MAIPSGLTRFLALLRLPVYRVPYSYPLDVVIEEPSVGS